MTLCSSQQLIIHKNIRLGFISSNLNEAVELLEKLGVEITGACFPCEKPWLLSEVIAIESRLQGHSIKPLHLLVPGRKLKVLGFLKSGVRIISIDDIHHISLNELKNILVDYSSNRSNLS